jgi:hypothetical protein
MNEQNLDYLKDNLKYLGFGDRLYPELEKNIQQGFPEFKLSVQNEYGKDKLDADLFFKKSDQSDMYFFNRYDAKVSNDAGTQSQSFYINRGNGFTLKEAYNLLDGRAVNKDLTNNEGLKYNAWVKLDFTDKEQNGNYKMKHFHQNYGYNLESSLSKLPVKELNDEKQKEMLIRSLERGNVQTATVIVGGKENRWHLEANPQFKTINVYDDKMQRVQFQSLREKNTDQQSVNEEAKKEGIKKAPDNTEDEMKINPTKNKRKGQSIS